MRKFYFLVLGLLFISGVKAQIVNIPDANFKAKLLAASTQVGIAYDINGNYIKIDTNNNGEIEISEVQNIDELSVYNSNISDLTGIENFINLRGLYCYKNQIASLDLKGLVNLKNLYAFDNQIMSLNLVGLVNLNYLSCENNQITSLNLTGLNNLTYVVCSQNKLNTINLQNLSNLGFLDCSNNNLTSLDISNLSSLKTLRGQKNLLASIIFNNNISLSDTDLSNNLLINLDLTQMLGEKLSSGTLQGYYQYVKLNDNLNLTTINCKNGKRNAFIFFYASDIIYLNNLKYICGDDYDFTNNLQNQTRLINVNSYCSFTPGGTFYTIKGNTKLDSNNNGCDDSDIVFPNLKFSITDGTISGSLIANTTGKYTIPVQAGTHTITPVLENPSYFTVSPINPLVTFPTQASPFTQDFCVTANGIHPDLEVTALPTTRARAGFDASYKIIYKNKGNQTQSGSVNLTFEDAVLDFVSASPVATTQSTNNLFWNFTNLKPFETREIIVTVNVNGPMETPAVNGGDTLDFTTTITSTLTDETPTDNTFTLNQTVVNAFDPNDKTCLEGPTIPPSAVGKYVHYLIRFENKGTAEAQNVVVKDMIDTSKFDVNSLVVTQGSHPFVTRISETNKVEFIFENINLPFDDATNDGYVAFKIKTKPSLVVGDSFSNTASIYFDYNFPIVTNTATTSVLQSLGNIDFEFDSYFSVYPNPAKNSLNVDIKKQIKVSSISIYNTLGQQILVIPNAQYTKQVDVSNLKTGNYFIKLISDKGSSVGKFLKS